jgi:hypothetical protein
MRNGNPLRTGRNEFKSRAHSATKHHLSNIRPSPIMEMSPYHRRVRSMNDLIAFMSLTAIGLIIVTNLITMIYD